MISFLAVLIPGQLLLTQLNIWNPIIRSLITRRVLALDTSPDDMRKGIFAGVSDPSVSSMKKFGLIEDDIGMLWLTPEFIRYRGDGQSFEIRREQLLKIERVTDKGSIAAYAGAVHIILHWQDDKGAGHMTRLHLENYWTLGALARMFDDLNKRLLDWKG